MSGKTRRSVLLGITGPLIALAGCSSSGSNGESQKQREELISGTYDIGEDEYRNWMFSLNSDVTLEYFYTVTDGPSIDVLLMDERAFDHFENMEQYQYIPDGSSLDAVSESVEVDLPAEDGYVLVLDNTNAGEASPPTDFEDNVARVEIEAYISSI